MENYYAQAQQFCLQLMEALDIGLGLPEGKLPQLCVPDASELRLLHYPAIAAAELRTGDTARIWPHTDFGLITLLLQDDVGGLEVQDPLDENRYIEVTREQPGEIIVNISATFERWTNGVIKAAVHWVNITPDKKDDANAIVPERWSVAYFLKAHQSASAGPLSHFVTSERPARYADITALQFQQQRTELVYTDKRRGLEVAASEPKPSFLK
jgi:isopenicillin N synthase-like dioxygenase